MKTLLSFLMADLTAVHLSKELSDEEKTIQIHRIQNKIKKELNQ